MLSERGALFSQVPRAAAAVRCLEGSLFSFGERPSRWQLARTRFRTALEWLTDAAQHPPTRSIIAQHDRSSHRVLVSAQYLSHSRVMNVQYMSSCRAALMSVSCCALSRCRTIGLLSVQLAESQSRRVAEWQSRGRS